MAVVAHNDKPIVYPHSAAEWEAWLDEHGGEHPGIRLQLVKKGSTKPGIRYPEALDVALCFGWIDGQVSALDADFTLQSFTPRRPRSVWSQRNRDYVARLTAEGRMRPAGIAAVEAAKSDGRWDAAYRVAGAPVPDDLQAALDASAAASATFATLKSQARFAIIFRTNGAKRPETRARRIATFVEKLEAGQTEF
ncbi:YdeI/OmpD-associated family protein [Salinibacterium sp. SYSU T00001]|uniref:YdeI/OmpD-associated family protein n=1 Tax=Homoserinimonas sedimenticola TaxID=2986805 RepID=UPI00223591E9|nr:YdeI/OmpD-associated family protein [Salinibacterium sedimenticola]MCW4384791.1 YdeI/OmpD-associated family protein [Salinibacterium sedimenticola]